MSMLHRAQRAISLNTTSLGVLTESSHVPHSLRTTLCLQFSASDIANAVLYLGKATLYSKASDIIFFPSPHCSLTVRVYLLDSHINHLQRQSFSEKPSICEKIGGTITASNSWHVTRSVIKSWIFTTRRWTSPCNAWEQRSIISKLTYHAS